VQWTNTHFYSLIPEISLAYLQDTDFVNGRSFGELINAQCKATKDSLEQSGIVVDSISFDKIQEGNIGKIIIYYELLTSLVGAMLNVNTYNQPGVEQGKHLLYEHFKGKK
jgi:glucose-6-phosphate isomerase